MFSTMKAKIKQYREEERAAREQELALHKEWKAGERARTEAERARKEAERHEAEINQLIRDQDWDYPGLKVNVVGGKVTRPVLHGGTRTLGDLAGATAGVTTPTRRTGAAVGYTIAFGPIGLAALASGKAVAYITFADGTPVHSVPLTGNKAIQQAQLDAVRFNAASTQTGEVQA